MPNLDSQDGEDQLCDACAELEIEKRLTQDFSNEKEAIELGHRDYRDIREKKCCPLCRLVMIALDRLLDVELGQWKLSTQVQYQIRRFGEFQSLDHLDLVFINRLSIRIHDATSADNPFYQAFIQLSGEYTDKEEQNLHNSIMRGRGIKNAIDISLVKSWLDSCEAEHDSKCSPRPLSEESGWPSFKLIDVRTRQVVPARLPCQFVALSYVWGVEVPQLKLTENTSSRLTRQHGLSDTWDDIPSTIKDAMTLCERLQVPFLWVDAVCIQQDNSDDSQQVNKMNIIYGAAQFTIVCAAGASSWAGLPGVQEELRHIPQACETVGNVALVVAQAPFDLAIKDSKWNTRAWTFQESVLSRRRIIFTEHQLFYECNNAIWWEDTRLEIPSYTNSNTTWLHLVDEWSYRKNTVAVSTLYEPEEHVFFINYVKLVNEYALREMTKISDMLRAFEGIMEAFKYLMDVEFFWGLPLNLFGPMLVFATPRHKLEARREGFPSWSWTGWKHKLTKSEDRDSIYMLHSSIPSTTTTGHVEGALIRRCRALQDKNRLVIIPLCSQPSRNSTYRKILSVMSQHSWHTNYITGLPLPRISDNEVQRMLVVEANSACLTVVSPQAHQEGLSQVMLHSLDGESRCVAEIHLDHRWRDKQGEALEFIAMVRTKHWDYGKPDFISTFVLDTDERGVSERVQICSFAADIWKQVKIKRRRVYLI